MVIALAHHERSAFLKFFLTYFFSVAILILAAGYFYFEQMQSQLMKGEHFSLIKYARHIKMGESLTGFSSEYHYAFVKKQNHIDIQNLSQNDKEFIKYIPTRDPNLYMEVFKTKKSFQMKLAQLKSRIIFIQIFLLFIFALLSYFLAKNALKPLNESIDTLDKFAKDLIHDLNTPVTAMKLNLKLLERKGCLKDEKSFIRLQQSVKTVSELHVSLTTLLENKTFQIAPQNICKIVHEVIELHQPNYPDLTFKIYCTALEGAVNKNALKQILHNLISNACKYNTQGGYVKIYAKNKTLYIEDSGVGIAEPDRIFDRSYSAQNSSGLGLDIVKRLCEAMDIQVALQSTQKGTTFTLTFQ